MNGKKVEGFTLYGEDGGVSIADNAGWLPGVYATVGAAVYAAKNLTEAQIERWLGGIYGYFGESRPVTLADVEEAMDKERSSATPDGLTDAQKLAKIEELMHPGFWGTFDFRREAILKVLESKRSSWHKEPDEYAGY